MPGTKRLGALLALLAAVVALSGCGSDELSGEIPAENAVRLTAALRAINGAVALDNCDGASAAANEFVAEVNALPADAGAELKAELRDAGINLQTLVDNDCASTEPTTTTESTTSTPPTSTSSTTEPTTTEPTTTTTDTTTTTSTDATQPPDNGNGNGPPGGDGPPGQDGGTGGTGSGSGDESDE